ncbi:MAG: hypothetical protein OEZ34_17190 [Spirochaetia bacterium]|nr:hypothetical protein [Spirochaetia bacterium]
MSEINEAIFQKVDSADNLVSGDVIRRISQNGEKNQQAMYVKKDEDGALLVAEVLDFNAGTFVAEGGKIRLESTDSLYKGIHTFRDSSAAEEARKILSSWMLLKDHADISDQINAFFETAFFPEQIMDLKKTDNLKMIYIPTQERFKIGKFKEKVNWNKVREDRFTEALTALADGKHLTYIAFIPTDGNHKPLFFSIGTKPHHETHKVLQREAFYFKPTHGGHIKIVSAENEQKKFVVDAGSNEFGVGVKTSVSTAELVTDALTDIYPDYEFVPLPGRDAYGIQQSY